MRLLGAHDSLNGASKTDKPSRQYFNDGCVGGRIDVIFSDTNAFFDRRQIHILAHAKRC